MLTKFKYIFILFFILFFAPGNVFAQTENWVIDNFHSDIEIQKNTKVNVTETIDVDFGEIYKHGIYRDIPVKYKTKLGNNLDIRFVLEDVKNENGTSLPTKVTKSGENINIRIGDPDKTITGKHTYIIKYQIERVVTRQENNVEFYWNVTGNDWPVRIKNVSATVSTPGDVIDTICFVGILGSTNECVKESELNKSVFKASLLNRSEGLTIALSLNESDFIFPTKVQEILFFLKDNLGYLIPVMVFFAMLVLYWQKGRDKEYKNIFHESGDTKQVPLFARMNVLTNFQPPKDLSPGEVGVIVDEKIHDRDMTAIIIDLARRGYIKIKETTKGKIIKRKDFEILNEGKDTNDLKEFEKTILSMFFDDENASVRLSKLPKDTYKKLDDAKGKLYEHVVSEGFFEASPQKVRNNYLLIGILVSFLGFFVYNIPLETVFLGILAVLALVSFAKKRKSATDSILKDAKFGIHVYRNFVGFGRIARTFVFLFIFIMFVSFGESGYTTAGFLPYLLSGLIIILFSFFMPARTAKGRKALVEIVGLKEYVRVGAWRQKKFEAWNYFEEILPYTIAFGLTKKFINAFKDANIPKPDWYQSNGNFNVLAFSNSMNSFSSSMANGVNATRPKSASSGGSGFSGGGSGGGFGGGGGGSW